MQEKTLEIIKKAYKPYKISRKKNCIILYTMEGNICLKKNTKIDYLELYKYLKARNFTSVPDIIESTRIDYVTFEYLDDFEVDKNQKANDLIKKVAELHKKTSFKREIKEDKYKEIKESITNLVNFNKQYYSTLFDKYLNQNFYSPSELLFLKNYTLIQNACNYCLSKIEVWAKEVKNNNDERICLIHNNLELDHYIKNYKEYLISWDNYTFDSPIMDLYKFYQKEWNNIPFKDLFNEYNKIFELSKSERLLLDILISIPYKIPETEKEINKCREYNKLIAYLNKSSKTVLTN